MSLIAILVLPLCGALVCRLARGRHLPPIFAITTMAAVLALAAYNALQVAGGHPIVAIPDALAIDGLSALIMLMIALVSFTTALYSYGYMAKHDPARLRLYYMSYNLFVFAMLAIPAVTEPTLIWIFVELTTLTSAFLVSFENTHAALEAAWKYVTLSLMGAAIALLGFLVLFAAMQAAEGTPYTWAGLAAAAPRMPPVLVEAAFVLILVGFGTKAGLVPLHTWLPDAHSQAPSPICALLSGVETTSVLYVILRLLPVLKDVPGVNVEAWAVTFGLISVGVAAFLLLQVRDYKRLFAYSTVEHMGVILVAAGLAGHAAHYSALYQVVSHSVTKSFCFFAAGAALLATETTEISAVRGLIRTSPAAAAGLMLGGLAIAGAPPFALFLSEFSIFRAGLAEGRFVAIGLLVAFVAIAFFGIMVNVNRMVFGTPLGEIRRVRTPASCVLALCVAGFLVIALGLYLPAPLNALMQLAATPFTK